MCIWIPSYKTRALQGQRVRRGNWTRIDVLRVSNGPWNRQHNTPKMRLKRSLQMMRDVKLRWRLTLPLSQILVFSAFVEESSHWQFGADKPGKFGWIANEIPSILSKETEGREKKSARSRRKTLGNYPFDQLSATDIVFLELNSVTKEGQFIFGLGNLLIRESLADFRVDIRHMFPKNDLFLNLEGFCNFDPTEH